MALSRTLNSLPSLDIAPVVRIRRDAAVETALVALQTKSAALTHEPESCFICGTKVKKVPFEIQDEPDLAKQVDLFKAKLLKEDPTCGVRREMVPCSNCLAILVKQVWEMDKVIKSINGQISQMLKRSLKLMDETNRRNKKIMITELNTSHAGNKAKLIAPPKPHPSTARSPPRVKICKPFDPESEDSLDSDEIEPQKTIVAGKQSSHHKIPNGSPTKSRNHSGNKKRKLKFDEDEDDDDDLFVKHVRPKVGEKQQDAPKVSESCRNVNKIASQSVPSTPISTTGLNPRNIPHRVENSVRQELRGHKETKVKDPKSSTASKISTLHDPSPTGNNAITINNRATYFPIFGNIRHQRTKKPKEETTKPARSSPRGKGFNENAASLPPQVKLGRKTTPNVVKKQNHMELLHGNEVTFSFPPQPPISRSISVENASSIDDITIKMEDCLPDELFEEVLQTPMEISEGSYPLDIFQDNVPLVGGPLPSILEKISYEIPKKGEFLLNPFKDLSRTRVDDFALTSVQKRTEKTNSRNNSSLTETDRKVEMNNKTTKISEPTRAEDNFRVSFHVPKLSLHAPKKTSFCQFNVNNQGPIQMGLSALHSGLDFGSVEQPTPPRPPPRPASPKRQRDSISTVIMSPKQKFLDVAPIQNPANKMTPFRCETCKKYFPSKTKLELHEEIGHAEPDENYACRICNKYFDNRPSLENHKRTKHDNDGFACSICGKKLSTRRICAIHEVTVCKMSPENEKIKKLGLKFNPCRFSGCKKLFYQCSETELARHEATHKVTQGPIIGWSSPMNPEFPCAKCGKKFPLKFSRQRHEKSCVNVQVVD